MGEAVSVRAVAPIRDTNNAIKAAWKVLSNMTVSPGAEVQALGARGQSAAA
jgi:hypothetical protein